MGRSDVTASPLADLGQFWPRPDAPRPIVLIGAGGIVADAHLPAYASAGLPVAAIYDPVAPRAAALGARFGIPRIAASMSECAAMRDVVFDVATPPEATLGVLEGLPDGASVLIQKPMGRSFDEAVRIRDLCRAKRMTAAANLQLRFSPMMLALRDAIDRGLLGEIVEVEVRLACATPWRLWPFMAELDAVEVPMHSIHYIDWIRSLLGTPRAVQSLSVAHPMHPTLKDARTTTILTFDRPVRCAFSLNHTFRFGPKHQGAAIVVEGLKGAARIELGLLLDYPHGRPETLEIVTEGRDWTPVPLQGRWFPDAFAGVMANLQRFVAGQDAALHTAVEDAVQTMAVVEACRRASNAGGTPVPGSLGMAPNPLAVP